MLERKNTKKRIINKWFILCIRGSHRSKILSYMLNAQLISKYHIPDTGFGTSFIYVMMPEFNDIIKNRIMAIKGIYKFFKNNQEVVIYDNIPSLYGPSKSKSNTSKDPSDYYVGAQIEIKNGIFENYSGIIKTIDGDKIGIDLSIYGTSIVTEVSICDTELLK